MAFDALAWLKRTFPGGRVSTSGWYRTTCPFHREANPSFAVHIEKRVFGCKAASCGRKGGIVLLIKHVEGISWREAYAKAETPDPFNLMDAGTRAGAVQPPRPRQYLFPLGLVPVSAARFPTYLLDRRYRLEDVEPFGLQFGEIGDLRGYLVFPFWTIDGEYRTYTARRMGEDGGGPRYLQEDQSACSAMLYGAWLLARAPRVDRIFVVEGQFDALRLWSLGLPAVSLSTAASTAAQRNQLIHLAWQFSATLAILLDRGKDAAQDEMLRRASRSIVAALRAGGAPAVACELPDGVKDPDQLGRAHASILLDICKGEELGSL